MSGLYLVTEQALAVGDHVELTMSVPDPDHPEVPFVLRVLLRGKVVRVGEDEDLAGVGIAFDEESGYLARAS